jgi:aminoglycoside 6'-N-acetyltransferase I
MHLSSDPKDVLCCREAIAAMLCDFAPATENRWPSMAAALAEVDESLAADRTRISIVAQDRRGGRAVGWVAGSRTYARAFELHPLVVHRDWQGRGIGRGLVAAFEAAAAGHGALTVYLGSDDTAGRTTLGGRPLFGGVLRYAEAAASPGGHPMGFYQKCGYEIVGVLPDVNGPGQPDIWLAKPVGRRD